jgi:hypothetical protein
VWLCSPVFFASIIVVSPFVLFQVMLAIRLDGGQNSISFVFAFLPLFMLLGCVVVFTGCLSCKWMSRRGRMRYLPYWERE